MFGHISFDRSSFDVVRNDEERLRWLSVGGINATGAVIYTPIPDLELGAEGGITNFIPLWELPLSGIIDDAEGGLEVPEFTLVLELNIRIGGMADMSLFPVGDLKVSVLDLTDISLEPYQTITIDTDEMIILFGLTHDVSSLSVDSRFFQLGVGLNRLMFIWDYEGGVPPSPLPTNELGVILIYENRWL
jgi:hypothetical protein